VLIILFVGVRTGYGQEGLHFSVNHQLYLKGNSALIGNNIVSEHATKPFNDRAIFNDKIKMEYIDVDDDKETFSSSQAALTLPEHSKKIVYAALYWSAIYKYDKGVKRTLNDQIVYKGNDERSLDVNKILFKTPLGEYTEIKGLKVYDSYLNSSFNDSKPYVCYSDVTQLLQDTETVNGNYTVANIKATEGYVSGGCSGGWLLYVVYENPDDKPKYFTTYNGFLEVDKKTVDITFADFKTNEIGDIKTSLSIGALEGDQKLKTDVCKVYNSNVGDYVPLYTNLRAEDNFFNSSITIDDVYFKNRTPNSINTLGFDLVKMDIPNKDNSILSNNSSELTIEFKTKADRFYLFFVAFETEISPIYLENKNTDYYMTVDIDTYALPQDKDLEKIKNLKSTSIPGLKAGYYLVTNVFSVEKNATNWKEFLTEKGHTPHSYKNPINNWDYIYLKNSEDPNEVYLKQRELSRLDYFEDIWVLKINM
ncbi:adhesin SprB, partial [Formosa agariphila KMM 3901]